MAPEDQSANEAPQQVWLHAWREIYLVPSSSSGSDNEACAYQQSVHGPNDSHRFLFRARFVLAGRYPGSSIITHATQLLGKDMRQDPRTEHGTLPVDISCKGAVHDKGGSALYDRAVLGGITLLALCTASVLAVRRCQVADILMSSCLSARTPPQRFC